jgi:hypothetical protein
MRDFARGLARLGGALRARGIATTLRDELDAAEALTFVDLSDKEEVRRAMRIALKIPRSGFETFTEVFGIFWEGEPDIAPAPPPRRRLDAPALPRGRPLHWDPDAGRMSDAADAPSPDGERPGYSPVALLRRKPFDQTGWSGAELAAMERLLARLARRVATHRSRRLVPTRGPGRPDLRSSYRRALASAGEVVVLARRARAIKEARLVFLLDTSGSMDAHGRFLMNFALSIRRAAPRAEVFAFNTELVHITASLAPGKVPLTLERLFTSVPDWSGGTRIGESLAAFAEGHLRRAADHKSIVVILSDGLDRGDPARLAEALRLIRRRARKVIWLNPLLGDPRYEPEALGMRVALPYVDHFASAHNLESLERLLPELTA